MPEIAFNNGKIMTAKSKKRAVKKGVPRKSIASLAEAKASGAEVVTEVPDLMTAEVVKQLAQVETAIGRFDRMTEEGLAENIKGWAAHAADYSRQAVHAGASALVYAWGCGKLLNEAKGKLGHGAFGKWRKQHVDSEGISERTSTRYMNLAKSCPDVRGLLQWAPTLRQAYVGCGVLPPPPEQDKDEADDNLSEEEKTRKEKEEHEKEVLRKKEVLLSSVSALQQKLRQGMSIKGNLGPGELRQLKLARNEIVKFFDQLLGSKS